MAIILELSRRSVEKGVIYTIGEKGCYLCLRLLNFPKEGVMLATVGLTTDQDDYLENSIYAIIS